MKTNRLDAVLTRNRKHLVLDVALAAFFLMALLFSGLAFGSQVPKLRPSPESRPSATLVADSAGAYGAAPDANADTPSDSGRR
ncbi:MAG TPA: hypothetical protein VKB80_13000 [Kofleriaceae bacterium]|nr:hypothetical protein [Kofleriaceae bacterium]